MRKLIEARGAELLFLASYLLLAGFESYRGGTFSKIKSIACARWGRVLPTREALVEEAIGRALVAVTPEEEDAAGWFSPTAGYEPQDQPL